MPFRVVFTKRATKQWRKLDPSVQKQIKPVLVTLRQNPTPQDCKQLQGVNSIYRLRKGNYRILYQIDQGQLLLLVVAVGHRRDIYDRL